MTLCVPSSYIKEVKKVLPVVLLLLVLAPFQSRGASAAALNLSPSSKTVKVGDTFTVSVLFDTASETVNNVKASITFPTSLLSVETDSIVTTGSAITDFKETIYSNVTGTIDIGGNTSVSGTGKLLANIKFKTKAVGTANVSFDADSQIVRSSDSKNVFSLTDSVGGVYAIATTITPVTPVALPEKKQATPSQIPEGTGFTTPTYILGLAAFSLIILGTILIKRPDQSS